MDDFTEREAKRQEEAGNSAEEFKLLVHLRTGLKPTELQCPREKSESTPCIARDGRLAVAGSGSTYVCVGCDEYIESLLVKERTKHFAGGS